MQSWAIRRPWLICFLKGAAVMIRSWDQCHHFTTNFYWKPPNFSFSILVLCLFHHFFLVVCNLTLIKLYKVVFKTWHFDKWKKLIFDWGAVQWSFLANSRSQSQENCIGVQTWCLLGVVHTIRFPLTCVNFWHFLFHFYNCSPCATQRLRLLIFVKKIPKNSLLEHCRFIFAILFLSIDVKLVQMKWKTIMVSLDCLFRWLACVDLYFL